jgi:hypothetical protein
LLLTLCFISVTSNLLMFCIAAELSPPPEPFESLADPEAIMDEVVTQLLNEAAETVLKEE